ncbi:FecR family protein [Xanthomonas arboricola]|uniref:FecR family protein n=1 Tax=Xanthomonas arboricola TaxID=56448 RepID=UPI000E1E47A8|nr:FecR domain-containing protein [Xanthomonas arboricola]
MSTRQNAQEIEQEAMHWVLRLDREGRTPAVCEELDQWLGGDVRRRGALLKAEATWCTLDALAETSDAAFRHVPSPAPKSAPSRAPHRGRWPMVVGACAAVAIAVVGLSVLLPRGEQYQTAIGEVRRVPLADRSTMAINTASKVRVAYIQELRAISLEQGEAWFRVAKNKQRPFVVSAGPVRVEAVGTAFSVRRHSDGADVMVTEGVVRVWVVGAEPRAVALSAGSALFIADTAVIRQEPEIAAPVIERKLAWRAGRLDLSGETLAEAVAEFNRYSPTPIVVAQTQVAQKRLFGVFRLDDPEGFARTAAITLGASIKRRDHTIVITDGREVDHPNVQ